MGNIDCNLGKVTGEQHSQPGPTDALRFAGLTPALVLHRKESQDKALVEIIR